MNILTIDMKRIGEIKKLVSDIYIKNKIVEFPVDILSIIKTYSRIRVSKYSDLMYKNGLSVEEVYNYLNTEEAVTDYDADKNRYLIRYNDINDYKSDQRLRWTLAHELGHILIGHLFDSRTSVNNSSLPDEEYKLYESEANYFAATLLANPILLNKYRINSENDLAELCDISLSAAKNRYRNYLKYEKYSKLTRSEKELDEFLNNSFRGIVKKRICHMCGNKPNADDSFCSICGNNIFVLGDDEMIYKSIDLNELHKAAICPVCGNEETNITGDYCQICGSYIRNKCTNCNLDLEGNARYCTNCGSQSTFYTKNLLTDWQTEYNDSNEPNYDVNFTLADEEMPF